jgi:hypothetical protein
MKDELISFEKIIMLPTEDKFSYIGKYKDTGDLVYNDKTDIPRGEMQHLYILSDDDIKEGDWVFDGDEVWRCDDYKEEFKSPYSDEFKKIIATTDPKLKVKVGLHSMDGTITEVSRSLPQIPQSLVEHYAKNQPEEVELEYNVTYYANPDDNTQIVNLKLQNNEVVWVEPKMTTGFKELDEVLYKGATPSQIVGEKLYTREEVERLCKSAWLHGMRTEGEKFSDWKNKKV